jgi:hypothetical protein
MAMNIEWKKTKDQQIGRSVGRSVVVGAWKSDDGSWEKGLYISDDDTHSVPDYWTLHVNTTAVADYPDPHESDLFFTDDSGTAWLAKSSDDLHICVAPVCEESAFIDYSGEGFDVSERCARTYYLDPRLLDKMREAVDGPKMPEGWGWKENHGLGMAIAVMYSIVHDEEAFSHNGENSKNPEHFRHVFAYMRKAKGL